MPSGGDRVKSAGGLQHLKDLRGAPFLAARGIDHVAALRITPRRLQQAATDATEVAMRLGRVTVSRRCICITTLQSRLGIKIQDEGEGRTRLAGHMVSNDIEQRLGHGVLEDLEGEG